MLGPLLALLSSITFALKQIFIRRASLDVVDAGYGTFISVPTALIALFVVLVINGQIDLVFSLPLTSYLWFSIAGILQFVVGLSVCYRCVQIMGANLTIVFTRINILVAVAIGILLLHEPVSAELLSGVLLIFIGVTVPGIYMAIKRGSYDNLFKIPLKAYFYVLLAGTAFGISPIFIKMGIDESGYPIIGAFVAFLAGTGALGLLFLKRKTRESAIQIERKSVILFFCAGIIFCIGNLFRFYALEIASASVVVPIISTMPIFTIIFSFLFNRESEIFNKPVLMGVISVVLGTILVFQ